MILQRDMAEDDDSLTFPVSDLFVTHQEVENNQVSRGSEKLLWF